MKHSGPTDPLLEAARQAAGDVEAALALATRLRRPTTAADAHGLLMGLGEIDLTVARVVEPHLDALMILAEAGLEPPSAITYGVFAAEAPGRTLRAEPAAGAWRLSGIKPWCSLGARLDRGLITAFTPTGRRLFDVGLHGPGVRTTGEAWVARGLTSVTTSDLIFDDVPAEPVGPDGWYLTRPGFAWGGIRVAAAWAGATQALVETLRTTLARRPDPDPLRAANLGRADIADWSARVALAEAGRLIDRDGAVDSTVASRLALRTRAVVADAAEVVLREVGHALGPAPLAYDETHARRVADLTLYVRQHHAERDLAALGADLAS